MKRLPTLANSTAGRRVILEQMQAIEELNQLEKTSLLEAYNNYGLQKIDRATAEKNAKEYRKDEEKRLLKKFEQSTQAQVVFDARARAPEGKIPARDPDGNVVYIWTNQADKAAKRGYEIL